MLVGFQRILALFTAAAVLLMSIDCACAGGMSAMTPTSKIDRGADAQPMPCCAHHGADHHCSHDHDAVPPHHPDPCKGSCEHCGQTVMNDTVGPPSHSLALVSFVSPAVADLDSSIRGIDLSARSSAPIPEDLPPPVTSPTLLSLHCALTN